MTPAALPSMLQRITRWPQLSPWRRAGLLFVFAWFTLGGAAHFVFTQAEMRIVPPWLGSPYALVMISGVCELLGAAGLVWHRSRRVAGVVLFLLTLAVTPANIYMLQHAMLFNIPHVLLVLRLPLQLGLLGVIAASAIVAAPEKDRRLSYTQVQKKPSRRKTRTGRK